MQARYYDPIIGRFLSTDPIGYQDQLNLYAYVANDPVNATDPTGEACVGQEGGNAVCDPPGDDIGEFTIPSEFQPAAVGPDQVGYHNYTASATTPDVNGSLADGIASEVAKNPTPGSDLPATPDGSVNQALPGIENSKVNSLVTTDSNGNTVVVNVTIPGQHILHPGYVAQAIIPGANSTSIKVVGEGNALIQVGPGSALGGAAFQHKINGDMRRAIYNSVANGPY